ncbi:MAG: matrixin family metalloprotease, partial [Actinomycetia bacterium]|nr:matrixin family metalloprotease [Actinomycetes bacterium]
MKTLLRISTLAAVLLGMVWLGGDRADGFSYFNYGGYAVIWDGGQSLRYLSPGTFPEGSETDTIIQLAMGQWTFVWGGGFTYTYYRLPEDPVVDHYDGYSDTAAVPAEWLDPGVLGVTYMVNNADQWFDMDIFFSDFPEGVGWHMLTNPDCEVTANPTPSNGFSFYLVATHELGHAIGLGHDPIGDEPPGSPWFIGTMNPGYPAGGPVGQNNVIELHTDDRRGVRFLYPGTPETKVDLANSGYCAQGPSLGKAVSIFTEPAVVTPGEVLTGWCVIENFGTVTVTNVHQSFYFSLDDTVDSGDLEMGDTLWDIAADDGYEFSVEIDVPDLLPGEYYFGSMLDDLNEVVEEYEDNNDSITCVPFTIAQAVPAFDPFSQQVITCAEAFTGPTPQVPYPINMATITWSLDNPQPGMTIDPATGVISWPEPIKSPFEYDLDVRATNDAGTAVQTLRLAVHQASPAIVPILDQVTKCGIHYTGPTPVLTAPTCMNPILEWSLLTGPPGMTINASSGVVSWPDAARSVLPHTVSIRAINDVGEMIETFLLTVGSADGDL